MKNKSKYFGLLSCLFIPMSIGTIFSVSSCGRTNPKQDDWITEPLNKTYESEIDSERKATIYLYGFEYSKEKVSIDDLVVETTFAIPESTIDVSIFEPQPDINSFNLKLEITNAVAVENLNGSFKFFIEKDGQKTQIKTKESVFYITLFKHRHIIINESTEYVQLVNGEGTLNFSFDYQGAFEPSKLQVTNDFDDRTLTTVFESTITEITNVKINVSLAIHGALPNTAIGTFHFIYESKEVESEASPITINMLGETWIVQTYNDMDVIYDTGTGGGITGVVIRGFSFNGLTSEFEPDVDVLIDDDPLKPGRNVSVEEFDLGAKTLAVKFYMDTADFVKARKAKFIFNVPGRFEGEYERQLKCCIPVPEQYVTVSPEEVEGHMRYNLIGMLDKPSTDTIPYNTLVIPDSVQWIQPSSLLGYFAPGKSWEGVTYLDFSQAVGLTNIEYDAFNNNVNLTRDVILPRTVNHIGSRAFVNCNIESLYIPTNFQWPTTVDSEAFQGCKKINTIDLSDFKSVPDWIKVADNHIFNEVSHEGSDKGIIYINDLSLEAEWRQYLLDAGYAGMVGEWQFIERK
ncbi:MAG: leucine-rich repeat domain-containing protein [Mycoplasma sp.]|nr:leucine-rich repeat domain-containing protein [Candidatus Hennigella equi]